MRHTCDVSFTTDGPQLPETPAPARRKGGRGRPRKDAPPLGDGVIGVTLQPSSGKWRVIYVHGGVKRTRYYGTQEAAEAAAARLHLALTGPASSLPGSSAALEGDIVPEGKGLQRGDWAQLLWACAERVMRVTNDPAASPAEADEQHRTARTMALLATAAARHVDAALLGARIEELERQMDRIGRRRKAHVERAERKQEDREAGAALQ